MKFIIPLSAKSAAALNRNISNLHCFLSEEENLSRKINITNIAYTLQLGRDAMSYRVIFIVGSIPELVGKLALFLNDKDKLSLSDGVFIGDVNNDSKNRTRTERVSQDILKDWLFQGNLVKISEHWISDNKISWQYLYGDIVPNRISLPTYSFEKERYWPKLVESSIVVNKPAFRLENITPAQRQVDDLDLREKIESDLKGFVHQLLKVPMDKLDVNINLADFGFDSISLVKCARAISNHFKLTITPAQFFSNLTIGALANYLQEEYHDEINKFYNKKITTSSESPGVAKSFTIRSESIETDSDINRGYEPIAIVGMSGKFPKSDDLDEYWENLQQGKNCISKIPNERRDWSDYYDQISEDKTNVIWGGFIEGVKKFDPQFFGLSDEEAEMMDPQQRLLLTYAYKAIEDAGYDPKTLPDIATGVFIAIGNNGYDRIVESSGKQFDGNFLTGALPSVGPNRISYFFDLHGPSEPVETACASSLVAIHRAINEINNGVCDIAIVGGVNLIVTPHGQVALNKAGLLSKEGKCKPFSSSADGFVRAEGIGVLILKRLTIAEKDNDKVYALIRGSGINHNGRANFLTAPNPRAQSALLESVYKKAGIDINTITYIEAHGTGTELGDAVEIEGLKSAFRKLGYKRTLDKGNSNCAIGSVKSNIGHTELASGMASIIKVLYQIKNKTLVKTIHCDSVSSHLQLEESPFYIIRENQKWDALNDESGIPLPRRAGVSAFGLSGVNAHIILEEYIDERTDAKRESLPGYKFCENNYWAPKKINQFEHGAFNANKLNNIENNKLFLRWYGKAS